MDECRADPAPAAARGNLFAQACLSREILGQLAEKWAFISLYLLARGGPQRTSQMRRAIPGISEKMLIQTLRRLERNGFVARRTFGEVPPRVEYSLTPFGEQLVPHVIALDDFIEENYRQVLAARRDFDRASGPDSA